MAAASFTISGLVELAIQNTYEYIPTGTEVNLHVMNMMNCDILLKYDSVIDGGLKHHEVLMGANTIIKGLEEKEYSMTIKPSSQAPECHPLKETRFNFSGAAGEV